MLTVRMVSQRLGCSSRTVYTLIRQGDLDAFRLSNPRGPWRVTPEALNLFVRRRYADRNVTPEGPRFHLGAAGVDDMLSHPVAVA